MTDTPVSTEADLELFLRRRSLVGRTLPRPLEVYEDECLVDLLARATAENGYHDITAMFGLLGRKADTRGRQRAMGEGALDTNIRRSALNDLLGLRSTEDKPPFERTVRRGMQTWFGTTFPKVQFTKRRISPLALKEAVYYRAVWRVVPLGFDPVTRETLLEICPICEKRLGGHFTLGLQFCWNCRNRDSGDSGCYRYVDLRDFPQDLVKIDDEESLNFVASLADPRRFGSSLPQALHDDLTSLDRGELFHLVTVIGRHLTALGNVSGTFAPKEYSSRPVSIDPVLLAEAGRMLLEWPGPFQDFVGHIRAKRPGQFGYVSTLFSSNNLKEGLLKTILRIVNDERRTYQTKVAFSRVLNQRSPDNFHFGEALAERGRTSSRVAASTLERLLDARHDVPIDEMQARLTFLELKPGVSSMARTIGVPFYTLFRMVDDGLLPPTVVDHLHRGEMDEACSHLWNDIVVKRCRTPVPNHTFNLAVVINALSLRLEQPWSTVVRAASRGEFEFWLQPDSRRILLRSIRVREIGPILSLIEGAPRSEQTLGQIYISNRDAALTAHLEDQQMSQAVRHHLLKWPITIAGVHRFRSSFIKTSEIPPRLIGRSASVWKVFSELEKAGVPTLGHRPRHVRDRAEVEGYFRDRLVPCISDFPS